MDQFPKHDTISNQPSIELDTIYEKVDMDKTDDENTYDNFRETRQQFNYDKPAKPSCKPSRRVIFIIVAVIGLVAAAMLISLMAFSSLILSTTPKSSISAAEKGITCQAIPAPADGEVSVSSNANTLTKIGLGSVAAYSCNTGFVLVGQTTRVCEDTNGGTVITGTWSGTEPTCRGECFELPRPDNGKIMLTPGKYSNLSLGSVATYSCNTGFILVGQTTRVCEDTNGGTVTTGTWSGSEPTCQEIQCLELPEIENGIVSTNQLNYSLESVATYSCNTGYGLVGQTTRVCEDTNGGTVTTGTWSGTEPTCQEVQCSQLTTPGNGEVTIGDGFNLLPYRLGSVATYSCNVWFVLVGQTTRVCEDTNGGTWSGRAPTCQATCSALSAPGNGTVLISSESNATIRYNLGSVATYSCNTGYGIVGQTTRVCEDTNGGTVTTGTWSGTEPTCQEIHCPELSVLGNGTIDIVPGDSSTSLGLGFVATYSCNTGFVLVGQTTRVCEDTNGGTVTTGTWSGNTPICQEVRCSELSASDGGTITVSDGVNLLPYSLGSVATYSCNTGFILVGQMTRVCEDTNGGTWSGREPTCQVSCSALSDPGNGTVMIAPDSNTVQYSLGSVATYSCNTWFGLVGQRTRTCQETVQGTVTTGTWSGSSPTCESTTIIDCQETDCRSEQLTCPERSPCTVNCRHSRLYPCYQTTFTCSSGGGDCNVNCDDEYACFDADMICPEGGKCGFNCDSQYSCQHTAIACSPGDGHCIVNCGNLYACRYTNITCPEGGNCTVNCDSRSTSYDYRCRDSVIECKDSAHCAVNCDGGYGCYNTTIICSGEGGDCSMNCDGNRVCQYANITCPKGKDCTMSCGGYYSCQGANLICPEGENCTMNCNNSGSCGSANMFCPEGENCNINCYSTHYQSCERANIKCPEGTNCNINCTGQSACLYADFMCSESEKCALTCSGYLSCGNSIYRCPEGTDCNTTCTGRYACSSARFICPDSETCAITCTGRYACQYARFTCPVSETCAITCNDQYSCSNTNFQCPEGANCTINCNGQFGCNGATVTCPTGDYSCNINCTDPLSCSNLRIVNTHNVNLQCCGDFSCDGVNVIPTSMACPFLE